MGTYLNNSIKGWVKLGKKGTRKEWPFWEWIEEREEDGDRESGGCREEREREARLLVK